MEKECCFLHVREDLGDSGAQKAPLMGRICQKGFSYNEIYLLPL